MYGTSSKIFFVASKNGFGDPGSPDKKNWLYISKMGPHEHFREIWLCFSVTTIRVPSNDQFQLMGPLYKRYGFTPMKCVPIEKSGAFDLLI